MAFLEEDVPTGGTSAALTPRTRSQTQCKSGSKSILEASHNVVFIDLFPVKLRQVEIIM